MPTDCDSFSELFLCSRPIRQHNMFCVMCVCVSAWLSQYYRKDECYRIMMYMACSLGFFVCLAWIFSIHKCLMALVVLNFFLSHFISLFNHRFRVYLMKCMIVQLSFFQWKFFYVCVCVCCVWERKRNFVSVCFFVCIYP